MSCSRPARLPLGLLGALTLVVLVESAIEARPLLFGPVDMGEWARAGRAATRPAIVREEILLFGDSMTKLGLQPLVIQERLGRSTTSLAVSAGPPAASFYLLRRALDAGARPRAVLVDFHPHLLQVEPAFNHASWPNLLTPGECLDLCWAGRDATLFAQTMARRYLPSLHARQAIRDLALDLLSGEQKTIHRPRLTLASWRNWNRNKGGHVADPNPGYDGSDQGHGELYPAEWTTSPVSVAYARRFLELAEAEGIEVFWVIPPFAPVVERQRRELGLDAAFDGFVQQMQAGHLNVTVIDGRGCAPDHGLFADAIHFSRDGAAAFSAAVADAVQPRLGVPDGDRVRVELAEIGSAPASPGLENLGSSFLAIAPPPSIRR